MDVVNAVLDANAMPTIPTWVGDNVRQLVESCLDRDPPNRPSFDDIIQFWDILINQRDYENHDWFKSYDVPRMIFMLKSSEVFLQLLATQELIQVLKEHKATDIPHASMTQIVERLTALTMDENEAVQERGVTALELILRLNLSAERLAEYRRAIRAGNGMYSLFTMLQQKELEPKFRDLIKHVLSELSEDPEFIQELHKSLLQLEFTKESLRRFMVYEHIVQHDIERIKAKSTWVAKPEVHAEVRVTS
jgi:hypothetical protein